MYKAIVIKQYKGNHEGLHARMKNLFDEHADSSCLLFKILNAHKRILQNYKDAYMYSRQGRLTQVLKNMWSQEKDFPIC